MRFYHEQSLGIFGGYLKLASSVDELDDVLKSGHVHSLELYTSCVLLFETREKHGVEILRAAGQNNLQ